MEYDSALGLMAHSYIDLRCGQPLMTQQSKNTLSWDSIGRFKIFGKAPPSSVLICRHVTEHAVVLNTSHTFQICWWKEVDPAISPGIWSSQLLILDHIMNALLRVARALSSEAYSGHRLLDHASLQELLKPYVNPWPHLKWLARCLEHLRRAYSHHSCPPPVEWADCTNRAHQ